MHNTDLLEDLVGMIGLDGDDDNELDLGSNYQYGQDIKSPQYNSHKRDRSSSPGQFGHDNSRYGATFNGRIGGKFGSKLNGGWRDNGLGANGVLRPGSSTSATIRDLRSRTDGRVKRKSLESHDMNDAEIELNSLDRDSHILNDDAYNVDFNGTAKRRVPADEFDRSAMQLGTDEDNSQIKLIPKDMRGSDSNLQVSDVGSKLPPDIEMQLFDERSSLCARRTDITQTELVHILERTLYQYYLIDAKKFNIRRSLKKVDAELVMALLARIKFKVNKENRNLNKINIDFGPYPLSKAWQIKKEEKMQIENDEMTGGRGMTGKVTDEHPFEQTYVQRNLKKALLENQKKTALFLAPDEDNYSQHGIKNLVIKY